MVKPLHEQVVVITGASSGIGRATALAFADRGAAVVLTARNEEALYEVESIVRNKGGQALVVPGDISKWEDVQQVAKVTIDTFGRIDTWVNNAGISLYATADDTTVEEAQQIMQTNFMGVVHGVNAALQYMQQQRSGTIINVGSVESKRALPLQALYAASKHAVKAYTETLRMEQAAAKSGIHVTLILPAGINTPLFNHARSKVGVKPMPIPPAYSPELVARAIVSAAESPQRDIYVGGAGFFLDLLERIHPALADRMLTMNQAGFNLQKTDEPDDGRDNLFQPMPGGGRVFGDFESITKPSLYTQVFELSPKWLRRFILMLTPVAVAGVLYKKWQSEKS